MNNFLLDVLSLGAIISAIFVIISKNPVISVLFLISVFVNAAGYLVLLGIGFIGISYLIVYIGAVTVLFLFVIMMLNLQLTELNHIGNQYTKNLPLGTILGSLFLFELYSIIPIIRPGVTYMDFFNQMFLKVDNNANLYHVFNTDSADTLSHNFIQIQSLGFVLYTSNAIWLIIGAIILLLSMVGPIVLSLNTKSTS